MIKNKVFFIFFFISIISLSANGDIIVDFSYSLERKYKIPSDYTINLLKNYKYQDFIIKTMDKPAESLPWNRYKKIFLNKNKIDDGIAYFKNNKNDIMIVASKFNFPPEILVAILGVESNYGKYNFSIKAVDALCTLAFHYERRSKFFLNELEYFILYTFKNKIDPNVILSSYAGAIGLPQFMPSSIIKYGYDFDGDNMVDLNNSTKDTLASIANYLIKKGWQHNGPVAYSINKPEKVNISDMLNKTYSLTTFKKRITNIKIPVDNNVECKIIQIDNNENQYDYWLTFKNFDVLKSYNHSNKYALAVFLLSNELKKSF
jgi:membrane-bound lytic murein transglycosylase B